LNNEEAIRFHREGDRFISSAFSVLLAGFTCDPERIPKDAEIHFGFWANQAMEKLRGYPATASALYGGESF
jgi:hypothetical protein